jgi:hypothetical protein
MTILNIGRVRLGWTGEWDALIDYTAYDAVTYEGGSYACTTDSAAGILPTNTTYWQVMALKGVVGDTGAAGSNGTNGDDGNTGPQGIQGIQGDDGPQGIQGITGDQGATGSQGIQGEIGVTGDTGPQGSTGLKGDTGSQGIQGVQGIDGPQGPDGPVGDTAYEEAVAAGFAGTESAWLTSLIGDDGPQGSQGIQGSQGLKGDIGTTGAKGDQGVQGTQGIEGDTGPQGTQGIKGDTGTTGAVGDQGIQGTKGNTGNTGSVGPIGNDGPSGPTGADSTVAGPTGPEGSAANVDTANVTAAGAIMDSEIDYLAAVKAFNPAFYATGTQGATADSALQPTGDGSGLTGIAAGVEWLRKTASYTAVTRDTIIADTSGGAWTLTLPATPNLGDYVQLLDGADWATNNLEVARNGSTIEGTADDLVVNIGGIAADLVFDGTTWQVTAQVGGQGGDAVTLTGTQTLTNKTLTSPVLTGIPTAPTAAVETDTTQVATTAFVLRNSAPLASPAFTGTPAGPTANVGTDTTQLATTAFVLANAPSVDVGEATAALAVGAVGTYAFLRDNTARSRIYYAGSTYAGSQLKHTGFYSGSSTGNTTQYAGNYGAGVSGTWRAMGSAGHPSASLLHHTLFLRIS